MHTPLHEHELQQVDPLTVYSTFEGRWKCNNCNGENNATSYPFHCSPCSFNLCYSCAHTNINENSLAHQHHQLVYLETRRLLDQNRNGVWSCAVCRKTSDVLRETFSYHCASCANFAICRTCFEPRPHPIHHHVLKLVDTAHVYWQSPGCCWQCDICGHISGKKFSHHCEDCKFDACLDCFKPQTTPLHTHPLYKANTHDVYAQFGGEWRCHHCASVHNNPLDHYSWHCPACKYDLCQNCMGGIIKGSLLADVLKMKPYFIDQLALCLDRETRVIPNWKHLSRELKVDEEYISCLEKYTYFSPTIKLFEYLELKREDLTIQQLKQAFLDIKRNDLFSLLTAKGCINSERVSEVTTSRSGNTPPGAGLLDEIAFALDGQDKFSVANWRNLACKLGVPLKLLFQFEHFRSHIFRRDEIVTYKLFEYLSDTCPQMTLQPLKEALKVIKRHDLLKILQDQNLKDGVLLKDVVTPGSELLKVIAKKLEINQVPWAQDFRRLANHLKIPYDVYRKSAPERVRRISPTKVVLEWLVEHFPGMRLIDVVEALNEIQCNHAIQIIAQEFPDVVEISLEINLRGPLALEAYKKALTNGKACVKRVPVMLIGQDHSGKTSLKKSLMGRPFDSDEDSTVGIDVDPSHFKVLTEIWRTGENAENAQAPDAAKAISFEHNAARFVAKHLKKNKNKTQKKEKRVKNGLEVVGKKITKPGHVSSSSNSALLSSPSGGTSTDATESLQTSNDSKVDDKKHISDASYDPTLSREDHPPLASPKIPDGVATLIKKILQEVEKVQDEEEIYSVLWDFGGQSVYYATHPLFMTPRAIYFLVYDLSRNPHERAKPVVKQGMYKKSLDSHGAKINLDYLNFWMTSVASLGSPGEYRYVWLDGVVLNIPPVFLVCTHADEPHDGADPFALAREVFGSLQTKPYKSQLYDDVFVVDNTKSGVESECSEVKRLRKKLLAVAKDLPQMKEAIPIKWLEYEKALQVTAKEGHKCISLEMAKQIASEVCKINDDQEFCTLLNFLHDQRILIHFDDTPVLNNLVVLDPQWLVDVFKKVITVKPYNQEEREFKELWRRLESTGILDEKLLEHEWGPLLDQQETSASLIEIMEKFSLLCPWPSSGASCGKQYLVPSMLMSHPPQDIIELVASAEIPSLFFKFESGQVPPGLFSRLVLQFFQWGQDEFWSPDNPHLYLNFARFYTSEDEDCSVILLCHSSSIEVVVHRGNLSPDLTESLQSKLNISADVNCGAFEVACARAVRRQLGLMLECMRKEFCWLKNMKYEEGFICSVCCQGHALKYCSTHHQQNCEQEECLHFWSESDLRSANQFVRCRNCATARSDKVHVKQFAPWISETLDEQLTNDENNGRLLVPEGGNDEKVVALPTKALESLLSEKCDSKEIVLQLKNCMQLDQASLEQPDHGTKKLIRCLATKAKESRRLDVVQHLREITPAGTTGPLLPERLDIRNIPVRQMTNLTVELSGGEDWKLVAEELGLTPQEIRFLDKRTLNPCEAVLAFISRQRDVSVGDLYDGLNKCGLPVTADIL